MNQDRIEQEYFLTSAIDGKIADFPWGTEQFDALIFVFADACKDDVEAVLRALVRANTDWLFTAGEAAKAWHDRIDRLSVEIGRQRSIGDGHPMTAWFDEIQRIEDWTPAFNFGGCDYFLFILVGCQESTESATHHLTAQLA